MAIAGDSADSHKKGISFSDLYKQQEQQEQPEEKEQEQLPEPQVVVAPKDPEKGKDSMSNQPEDLGASMDKLLQEDQSKTLEDQKEDLKQRVDSKMKEAGWGSGAMPPDKEDLEAKVENETSKVEPIVVTPEVVPEEIPQEELLQYAKDPEVNGYVNGEGAKVESSNGISKDDDEVEMTEEDKLLLAEIEAEMPKAKPKPKKKKAPIAVSEGLPDDLDQCTDQQLSTLSTELLEERLLELSGETIKKLTRNQRRSIQDPSNIEYMVMSLDKKQISQLSEEQVQSSSSIKYVKKLLENLPEHLLKRMSKAQIRVLDDQKDIESYIKKSSEEGLDYLTHDQIAKVRDKTIITELHRIFGIADKRLTQYQLSLIAPSEKELEEHRQRDEDEIIVNSGSTRRQLKAKIKAAGEIRKKDEEYIIIQFPLKLAIEKSKQVDYVNSLIKDVLPSFTRVLKKRTRFGELLFVQMLGDTEVQALYACGKKDSLEARDFYTVGELSEHDQFDKKGTMRTLRSISYNFESILMPSQYAQKIMGQLARYDWAPDVDIDEKISLLPFATQEGEGSDLEGKIKWGGWFPKRHSISAQITAKKSVRTILDIYRDIPRTVSSVINIYEKKIAPEEEIEKLHGEAGTKTDKTDIVIDTKHLKTYNFNTLQF